MNGNRLLMAVVLAAGFAGAVLAADQPPPGGPAARDPQIEKIVGEISPARMEATIRKLESFGTRHTLSMATSPDRGIGAAREWIKAELESYGRESGGRLQVALDAWHEPPGPRIPNGVDMANVVATLPGRQAEAKDRVYVVSGHYDSRVTDIMNATADAPGADDDGSGTAVALELARVMSRHRFDATIVFMAVAGEEQGLNGSMHWAKMAKAKGVDVAAMFTNDIVGNTLDEHGGRDRSHVRLFAEGVPPHRELSAGELAQIRTGGENDFPTRELARLIAGVGEVYVPQLAVRTIYRLDRYLRGGDHLSFLEQGYPAVRFTEPHEVFSRQHQDVREADGVHYGDTADYVDFGYAADVARVNAAAMAELADAPAPPRTVEVEAFELTNDTTLRWAANAEPDLAGYRIVWRETTAPQWQHAVDVPKETTRFTVKDVSKDNFIFGVEAFDAAGHASPAVYPQPRRKP